MKWYLKGIFVLVLFSILLMNIGSNKDESNSPKQSYSSVIEESNSLEESNPLSVPSDPNAQFSVLEKSGSDGLMTIVTKRVGTNSTSYAKRIYNCNENTVKYLGSGDSLEAMNTSKPSPNMEPIVYGSIAYYVGVYACS